MDTVIYHANCADGFGAALAAWLKLGDRARYIPAKYGDPRPSVYARDRVYVVDFSYHRADLDAMADQASAVIVLDHHKTAADALAGLPKPLGLEEPEEGLCARFDMAKSGAVLAWEYFWPGTELPPLLAYIQDRDLWQWKLEGSRAISAGLRTLSQNFTIWADHLRYVLPLAERGDAVLAIQGQIVGGAAARADKIPLFETLLPGGPLVRGLNATAFISETCEKILADWPGTDVACCYFDRSPTEREYSLRSRDPDGPDVSEIAKRFGGGGHRHAAGFVIKSDTPELHG